VVTKGYYEWQDADGKVRDKFMVCVPVEGAGYGVAATTYMDEFRSPMVRLRDNFDMVVSEQLTAIRLVAGITLLVAILAGSIFARQITRPLVHLTDIADRISLGDLKAKITVNTKDEIGVLADSLRRMQMSLRAAIERLRRT
jgi:nitrogen fixation/metabolism regulation signal transduction histidine kinase